VDLGWATVEDEPVGRRSRKRYSITELGRTALVDWHATDPEEPHFQIEGVLRTFFGDLGDRDDLVASMASTASMARSMADEMYGFVEEYLEDGGPLWMLEHGVGVEGDRREFRGRPMYPERLHTVALAIDVTTQLLETLDSFFTEASTQVAGWSDATDPSITPETRGRLERIRARALRGGSKAS
jgi:hypothetical protein